MPDRVIWTLDCQKALTNIQTKINQNLKLALPDISKPFYVQTDASNVGLGATLLLKQDGHLRPCFFLSRKLLDRETRYSVPEREGLGIVWALQKLSRYLVGNPFFLQTDHKPLKFIDRSKSINARICRWALILQQFNFTIQYLKGSQNIVADFLSRNV